MNVWAIALGTLVGTGISSLFLRSSISTFFLAYAFSFLLAVLLMYFYEKMEKRYNDKI